MKLEEAIIILEGKAEDWESKARKKNDGTMSTRLFNEEQAKVYRQGADWLRALKEIWDSGDCNTCANKNCKMKPKLGQLVRFNCFFYEEVQGDEISD